MENAALLKGFCVYDKIAKRYMPPFFCENTEVALRQFNTTFARNSHILKEDYQLYYVGSFNIVDGILDDVQNFRVLVYDGGVASE